MPARKTENNRKELEEFKIGFKKLLEGETDRGLALAGHAYLDDGLAECLRAYLLDDSRVVGELLRTGGPLGSFKTRCDIAYALGLIGPGMYKDLGQVREIRNAFAHSYRPLKFSASKIFDRCKNFTIPDLVDPEKMMPVRERFIDAVTLLAGHFHSQMKKTQHRKLGSDFKTFRNVYPVSMVVGEKTQSADEKKSH